MITIYNNNNNTNKYEASKLNNSKDQELIENAN